MPVNDEGGLPNKIPDSYLDLVRNSFYAVMSTIRHSDGLISSNPVCYLYESGLFRISTLKSRVKYHNLLAESRLTLCILSPRDYGRYIEIRGHATVADDPDRSYLRRQFVARTGAEPPPDLDPPGAERVVVTLYPEQVSVPGR